VTKFALDRVRKSNIFIYLPGLLALKKYLVKLMAEISAKFRNSNATSEFFDPIVVL